MIEEILAFFNIEGQLCNYEVVNSGNINRTFIITMKTKSQEEKKYFIQKVNTNVFPEPYKLMKNIENVTAFLEKQRQREGDNKHRVLTVIKNPAGQSLCFLENNGERDYYRVYEYIENSVSYDCSTDSQIVFNTGRAFGNFQKLLRNYPMGNLSETIENFHATDKRFRQLLDDIKLDLVGRVMTAAPEIVFLLKRENLYSQITSELGTEGIPLRVTHNDTKVNNVLMNKDDGDFLAVIDLDTVMPGSMLFDYGDGVRSTSANSKEDEVDLSKVSINIDLFKSYTDGYLSEMAPYLTKTELSLMGESIRIITLELAIRFLNDYINGDTYFKVNYANHNLDRARNQIALVIDIEHKLEYMNSYIQESYQKYMGHPRKLEQ